MSEQSICDWGGLNNVCRTQHGFLNVKLSRLVEPESLSYDMVTV